MQIIKIHSTCNVYRKYVIPIILCKFRLMISALWQDLLETVSALSRLIGEVQEDIRLSKDVWNKVFVR